MVEPVDGSQAASSPSSDGVPTPGVCYEPFEPPETPQPYVDFMLNSPVEFILNSPVAARMLSSPAVAARVLCSPAVARLLCNPAAACDPRIKPAIDHLNAAIDSVNAIEDERVSVDLAAARAKAVVSEELSVLEAENATLLKAVPLYQVANAAVASGREGAALAQETYEAAKDAAKDARARLSSKSYEAFCTMKPARADGKRAAAAAKSIVTETKRAAKRAHRAVQKAATERTSQCERLRKAGYAVADALRAHSECIERRGALEQVMQMHSARVRELDNAKEAATLQVSDAMGALEALSEELREIDACPGSMKLAARTPLAVRHANAFVKTPPAACVRS